MYFSIKATVGLVLLLLAKIFPYKPKQVFTTGNFYILRRQYAKWEFFGVVLFFMLTPSLIYGFGSLFFWMNALPEKKLSLDFLILPNLYLWFVPAIFLTLAIIILPITLIYRLLLRDRYDEYLHYTNLKSGIDGKKIFKFFSWILAICAIGSIFLMSDYSIEISNKQIVLNDFFTTDKKAYDFKQVSSISFVENVISKDQKKISPNPHYYVKFKDGNYWNTTKGLNDEVQQDKIMKYLAQKSNRKIDTVSYLID